jgi:hypothetical protein
MRRTKKKHKSIQPRPAAEASLDIQILELSEKIHRLRLSAPDLLGELEEILRALDERRTRRVVVGPDCRQYFATPLWIEPSPVGSLTNPACTDLPNGAFSMA